MVKLKMNLIDGNGTKITTLMDTGCSKPILNKKFYDKHPYLHQFPCYPLQAIGLVVANDGVIKVNEAIQLWSNSMDMSLNS